MNYWHMQLHPNDREGIGVDEVIIFLKKGLVGLGKEWDNDRGQPDKFKNEVKVGDIILVRSGGGPLALVEVIGPCFENQDKGVWFELVRKIKVLVLDKEFLIKEEYRKIYNEPWVTGLYLPLTIENGNNSRFIKFWHNKILEETQMTDLIDLLKANKNLILTGAPGTGKTYLAHEIANKLINSSQSSSSKPIDILKNAIDSFSINIKEREEYQRLLNEFENKFPINNLTNLALDDYCAGKGDRDNFCWWIETGLKSIGSYAPAQRGAFVYGIFFNRDTSGYKYRDVFQGKNEDDILNTILKSIQVALKSNDNAKAELKNKYYDAGFLLKVLSSYKIEEYLPIHSMGHINNLIKIFSISTNDSMDQIDKSKLLYQFYKETIQKKDITTIEFMRILYKNFNIPAGENLQSGNIINSGKKEFVQFHPSYDYTDFVEGLRPKNNDNSGEISFELKNGIFKEFCKKAKNDPNNNYVFIIDEINRGEISKIFGELFFSIDPGYRGEKGKVRTQYSNMQSDETRFTDEDNSFYVSEKVYIIGTMNDIDRSVESFDFAMRRRFVWKEITSEESQIMLKGLDHENEIIKKMNALNKYISEIEGLNSSYHIGAAYFLKLKLYNGDFNQLWKYHLEPLLKEYLRGMPNIEKNLSELKNVYDTN